MVSLYYPTLTRSNDSLSVMLYATLHVVLSVLNASTKLSEDK